jgi:UDP-N-acetylglucosamine 2-epimerase (non-hydrolysing)
MEEMTRYPGLKPLLVHTGQHYDYKMNQVFFEELSLPQPDINLDVGSASHAVQTARIMERLEKALLQIKPDLVLVVGDVNSTFASALVAKKMGMKVAHIEAGLRSFDRTMPEEINRILTDAVSDFLFVTEESGVENLRREGIPNEKIFLVGDVMIDTLFKNKVKANKSDILSRLGLKAKCFSTLTLHRPSNVDRKKTVVALFAALAQVQEKITIVFPAHPRTLKNIQRFGLEDEIMNMRGLIVTQPLGYLDFLKLLIESRFVLTDSGSIQEETSALGIPCLTLRENTERPITLERGTNVLVGRSPERIIEESLKAFSNSRPQSHDILYWDGHAAQRIVAILAQALGASRDD